MEQRAQLIRDLRKERPTLLFVKQGASLDELLRELPDDLEFVPRGRQGRNVITGIVQARN